MQEDLETLDINYCIGKPIIDNTFMLTNHINRYALAVDRLNICDEDYVIDFSCGMGYGSFFLSNRAKYVIGVDVNCEYLDEAIKSYDDKGNLFFMSYDELYDYKGNNWNKGVCIEALEHVPKDKVDDLVSDMLSRLCVGADLFLTMPLGNDEPSTYNRYHLNEMSISTIDNMFKDRFKRMSYEIFDYKNSFGVDGRYCYVTLYGYKGE